MQRRERATRDKPRSVPWPIQDGADLVAVDTTWGKIQPLEAAPGVPTLGELELIDMVGRGALLIDSRTAGSFGGHTIGGSVNIPHDEMLDRKNELDLERVSILFCNGPQCPQSPQAIRQLLDDGYPAHALAYYRGGMHDWVTLALPTTPLKD